MKHVLGGMGLIRSEERQLLQLLLENPEHGLSEAIKQYGKTVHWIVIKILGGDGRLEVEECTADVFVRLWQSAARFDWTQGTSLASWLYGIARHTALDYRRRQPGIKALPLEETDLKLELNLEEMLARTRNEKILRDVIDALPTPEREIFIYRYFLEMPVKEIAAQLNLSAKQVENKLYRGRLSLRQQLLEKGVVR